MGDVAEFAGPIATGVALLLGASTGAAALIGIGVGMASSILFKPKLPSIGADINPIGHLINTRSSQSTIPIVYGEVKVGGNIVYVSTTGANNEYLHVVLTLSEGPIDSLVQLYIDGKPYTDFGSLITYEFYQGTGSQAYSTALNSATGGAWKDPLRYTAYLYVKIKYDSNKFQAMPEITAHIRGRQLYDVSTGNTTYSNNPANVIWDFLTNTRYGLGLPSSYLDLASFQSAHSWYATNGFTFNGVIRDKDRGLDILSYILASCRSTIIYSQGKFKLLPLDYDPSVMNINEDMIIEGSIKRTLPSLQDLPNQVRVKFINPDNKWQLDDVVVYDANAVSSDGDVIEKEVFALGITNHDLARRIGIYHLNRLRWNESVSFSARLDSLELDTGDIFTLTYDPFGYNNKTFRVQSLRYLGEGIVEIEGIAEDTSIYDDTISTITRGSYTVSLPDPSDPNNLPPPYVNETDLTFALTQLPEGYNLIINSDFDNGLQNWVKFSGGDIQVVDLPASDSPIGRRAAQNVSTTGDVWWTSETYIPIQTYRTYIVEGFFRTISGTAGNIALAVQLLDENLNNLLPDGTIGTTDFWYRATTIRPPTSWTLYKGSFGYNTAKPFPSNAAYMRVGFILNEGTGADSQFQVTGLRIREMIESAFIVNGAIQTAHIQDASITSAKIADASITTAKIQDLAVDTIKIKDQAVTLPLGYYNSAEILINSTAHVTIASVSGNFTGAPVHVIGVFRPTRAPDFETPYGALFRGTTQLTATFMTFGTNKTWVFAVQDIPPAGYWTYSMQLWLSGADELRVDQRTLLVLEAKK